MNHGPTTLRSQLLATLEDLAAFGEKRVGTPSGLRAAEYLQSRFEAAGLAEVRFERFHFPRHDLERATLELVVGGVMRKVGFEVLEGSGTGALAAEVVPVGWASEDHLAARPVHGRIALVERNPIYHRSTQYQNVARHGAAGMISVSSAPGNLRQVGSVRRAWEAMGPVPALSIGAADGLVMRAALEAREPVHAALRVEAQVSRGVGQNVVGVVPGREPHALVVGAHYDTWFAGSTDNGGGVAALLALAERWGRRPPPRRSIVFVAWDGEEIALYGGYDFLRRHGLGGTLPTLAVICLETPAAHGALAYGLARSSHSPLHAAIEAVGLHELYAMNLPMDLVPELFGGVIPTDIQGLYRAGTPAIATAVDAPFYHTVEDTPDKVDVARLAETVAGFDRVLELLLEEPVERFRVADPALWQTQLVLQPSGDGLVVQVRVVDGLGRAQSSASVEATLFHDHFFETDTQRARTDYNGVATVRFARAGLELPSPRYLHITAGHKHPLAESVLAIP